MRAWWIILTAGVAGATPPPPVLPLPQAIEEALAHNHALTRSELQTRSAQSALDSARQDLALQWNPSLRSNVSGDNRNAAAGVTATQPLSATNGELRADIGTSWTEDLANPYRPSAGLEWRQPLLRGAGRAEALAPQQDAHSRWLNARRRLHELRADIALQVLEGFAALHLGERRLVLEADRLQRLTDLQRLAELRERQGRGTRIDTLRATQQREEAEARVSALHQQQALTRSGLNETLGRPVDAEWVPEPLPLPAQELPAAEEAVQVALSHRLDLARALEELALRSRDAVRARRDLWPRLDVVLRYERFDESTRWSGDGLKEDQWLVGFTGERGTSAHRREAALREAGWQRDDAATGVAERALAIQRQIHEERLRLRQARLDQQLAERAAAPAERRSRLARKLFELGRGSHFDVADAEADAAETRTRRLQADARVVVAHARLRHRLGTLLAPPQELVAILDREVEHTP